MKKFISVALIIVFSLILNAQAKDRITTASTLSRSNNVPNLISFQGRLTDENGEAINTTVDITFALYDDEIVGSALWNETQSVDVAEGLFNVTLGEITSLNEDDFSSADRWIGISVGTDDEMTPRTRVTAVPYALQAGTGAPDDDWEVSGNDIYNDTGYVGIGTTSPENKLHIEGAETAPLVYINKTAGGRGLKVKTVAACAIWVEYSGNHGLRVTQAIGDGVHITEVNGDGIEVESAGGFAGKFNGDGYFSGNLGLGTTSPARALHVNDYMRLEPVSDPPITPSAGDIYFDLEENMLKCYDGSTWQDCW